MEIGGFRKFEFEELMMKKNDNDIMYVHLCIYFSCVFWTTKTNEPLTLGVNAIITEIDKENKIITTKIDSGEEGVF